MREREGDGKKNSLSKINVLTCHGPQNNYGRESHNSSKRNKFIEDRKDLFSHPGLYSES